MMLHGCTPALMSSASRLGFVPWLFQASAARTCKLFRSRGIFVVAAATNRIRHPRLKVSADTALHKVPVRGLTSSHFKENGWRNIEEPDEAGNTPLLRAALDGDSEGVEVLLKAGADINARNKV
jgi:hypothetical protein